MMPEPDSKKWEDMVDFMRADLENDMGYTKLINTTKKMFEEQGRDFDTEFEKWRAKKVG